MAFQSLSTATQPIWSLNVAKYVLNLSQSKGNSKLSAISKTIKLSRKVFKKVMTKTLMRTIQSSIKLIWRMRFPQRTTIQLRMNFAHPTSTWDWSAVLG